MRSLCVTGGTGTWGYAAVPLLLSDPTLERLVIYSRDEYKQGRMREEFPDGRLRFFLGDVRDKERLTRALWGIEAVVHAAALKQVPACEYNPDEAVKTNVLGAMNVVEASIAAGVKKVMGISSDKAVNPVNLYGATKLCAEKLLIGANAYGHARGTAFSCVRYGNVLGSRGSVFEAQGNGTFRLTDERMTRFFFTAQEAVRFTLHWLGRMQGGEVFVPKLTARRIAEMVEGKAVEVVGMRVGEKLHEVLISADEQNVVENERTCIVEPVDPSWAYRTWEGRGFTRRAMGEAYRSLEACRV